LGQIICQKLLCDELPGYLFYFRADFRFDFSSFQRRVLAAHHID